MKDYFVSFQSFSPAKLRKKTQLCKFLARKIILFCFPANKHPLMPIPNTYSRPPSPSYQQQTFPYYSRTIPVLFPYNKADHDQRRSMTYQSTILGNFCCNKTIVSVFVSKNNVKNQLLFAQFKEKQYLCPRNRRWGCGWGARRTDTERTKQKSIRRALRVHHIF